MSICVDSLTVPAAVVCVDDVSVLDDGPEDSGSQESSAIEGCHRIYCQSVQRLSHCNTYSKGKNMSNGLK